MIILTGSAQTKVDDAWRKLWKDVRAASREGHKQNIEILAALKAKVEKQKASQQLMIDDALGALNEANTAGLLFGPASYVEHGRVRLVSVPLADQDASLNVVLFDGEGPEKLRARAVYAVSRANSEQNR